jgi:hypothetical protein
MSKFNVRDTRSATQSPIVTDTRPTGQTYEGAEGYGRDTKSELFLLAVANMVGEASFYEQAGDRDDRYADLVRSVAVADADWTLRFLRWLRGEANMRSASLVGAVEAVKARLDVTKTGLAVANGARNRQIIGAVLQRADEPGEMLAYWTSRYGRAIPKPVKRGIADAVSRLYTEFNLLKYDTASKGFRFGDVLDLVHPTPDFDLESLSLERLEELGTVGALEYRADRIKRQGDLFRYALDRRHGRDNGIPESLIMVRRNAHMRAEGSLTEWLDSEWLRSAGMTWEDVLSAVGSKVDKAKLWTALIPTMGYMALLRNLRNFDEAGVPDDVAATVAARLADPEQVAKSRQFPFRFLAAHRNAPSLRWGHALDRALTASLANVPELTGRSLVLVDRSGSMFNRMSAKSELTSADAAAVFGSALALRNVGRVDLVEFGTGSNVIPVKAGDSLLRTVDRFRNLGGTQTAAAVRTHYRAHDRVLIVTDEQAWAGYGDPGSLIPPTVPLYTWSLVGYRHGHGPGSPLRYTFGGLTDAAFRMVPLLEAGRNAWPF